MGSRALLIVMFHSRTCFNYAFDIHPAHLQNSGPYEAFDRFARFFNNIYNKRQDATSHSVYPCMEQLFIFKSCAILDNDRESGDS
jgi:hypothetical protein